MRVHIHKLMIIIITYRLDEKAHVSGYYFFKFHFQLLFFSIFQILKEIIS